MAEAGRPSSPLAEILCFHHAVVSFRRTFAYLLLCPPAFDMDPLDGYGEHYRYPSALEQGSRVLERRQGCIERPRKVRY
jgi:hypothetical protein